MSSDTSHAMPSQQEHTTRSESHGSQVHLLRQGRSNNALQKNLLAGLAEFVGTFLFLFFSFGGTQLANTSSAALDASNSIAPLPNTTVLLYIALSFGFSLMVNVWVFFRISGGLFNPSVSTLVPYVPFVMTRLWIDLISHRLLSLCFSSAQ